MKIRHIEIRNFRGIKHLQWYVQSDFNCIIGPGDTCKSTILTALDYALSPRISLYCDDSDFYNQNIDEEIIIQVTLTDWDEGSSEIQSFFREHKFGQSKCGLNKHGSLPEPEENGPVAISISLRIDKTLEPKWSLVQGRDESQEQDRRPIYASDRAILGANRIDISSDSNFTWGRNTVLTRLSEDSQTRLSGLLSELTREIRQSDISEHQGIVECQSVASSVQLQSQNMGVRLDSLSPQIDVQKQSIKAGAISLHEGVVPIRNKGSGSKKLISSAMQMKLHNGNNIALADEIELGLEPHRIRGLIYKLKNAKQQIFTTTHSPVVLRELNVATNELIVCKRDRDGIVYLESLNTVPDIQGAVRSNAEAFLGSKIVVCEGPTEIGCLRALDEFSFNEEDAPVWSLATCYFNAGGINNVKDAALKLASLGYKTAVFCDNDALDDFQETDKQELIKNGVSIFQWEKGNSTEDQIFKDISWDHIPAFLNRIIELRDFLELENLVSAVNDRLPTENRLTNNPEEWEESPAIRAALGKTAHKHKVNNKDKGWIKRPNCAWGTFAFLLPLLPANSYTRTELKSLWDWIQNDG